MNSSRPTKRAAAITFAALLAGQGIAQEKPERYDPREGIDPDGRITRPDLPEGLPNPKRWRYVPEGRIKPGSIFDRFLVSTFISPIIFREPDIGFGGGIALTDIDFRNQRRQEFANIIATISTEGQQQYRFDWRRWTNHIDLPDGGILQDERSFWNASVGYERTLTRRFFGLGADTTEDDETSYTDQVFAARLGRQLTLPEAADDWIVRLGIAIEGHNLSDGRVSGVPSTATDFPALFADADNRILGWLTGTLEWNTRDSLRQPYQGTTLALSARGAPIQNDGSTGALFTASGTQVFPIPSPFHSGGDEGEENPPTDTIAVGAFATETVGDLPFYSLPSLGGSNTLRGYINNRFTDRAAWHAAVEYRFWFVPRGFRITDTIRIERVGGALFYELGSVADDLGDLLSSTVRQSWGGSLRFALERVALFRVDLGFSEEDTNLTIAFGLPF